MNVLIVMIVGSWHVDSDVSIAVCYANVLFPVICYPKEFCSVSKGQFVLYFEASSAIMQSHDVSFIDRIRSVVV